MEAQNIIAIVFLTLCAIQLIIGKISLRKHPNPMMRQSRWMKLIS